MLKYGLNNCMYPEVVEWFRHSRYNKQLSKSLHNCYCRLLANGQK